MSDATPAAAAAPAVAAAAPAAAEAAAAADQCASAGCGQAAKQSCPTCIQLGITPVARFCSQECFKGAWKEHNIAVHKPVKERLNFVPPPFDYTGDLRPAWVSPRRTVPAHIQKPDYAANGQPQGENQHSIHINSAAEIKGIRAASRLGRQALDLAHAHIRPGITTDEIDRIVHDFIISKDAYPSPLNYRFFPKSCCTSVNEVICHGIPDARPLQDGDIVNVDVTVYYKGYHGDLNETFCVGNVDEKSKELIKTTHDALMAAVAAVQPGVQFRDFGEIITKAVGKSGFSVVRSYCGHGIGSVFHTSPSIPHYARNKAVGACKPGMVFSIEPMINMGTWKDKTWTFDDWTSVTADGKRSAQFEHTVLVTEKGCEVLTARTKDSPPLWWEKKSTEAAAPAATEPAPAAAQ